MQSSEPTIAEYTSFIIVYGIVTPITHRPQRLFKYQNHTKYVLNTMKLSSKLITNDKLKSPNAQKLNKDQEGITVDIGKYF